MSNYVMKGNSLCHGLPMGLGPPGKGNTGFASIGFFPQVVCDPMSGNNPGLYRKALYTYTQGMENML